METFLQIGGRFPQPADCSSNLGDVSAASGLLLQSGGRFRSQRIVPPIWRTNKIQFKTFPHFCKNNRQPAETSRTFATAFRSQRKRPALLQEQSATSGNATHFCRNIPQPAEKPYTFAGAFRWLQMTPALLQQNFEADFGEKSCGLYSTFNFKFPIEQILEDYSLDDD